MKRVRHVRNLREDILDTLRKSPTPVQLLDLSKRLNIRSDSDEYDYLRQVLTSMADEGIIQRHSRRRYGLRDRETEGFTGILTIHHDSATVQTDDREIPVIHVRRQHMHTALDGDTVLVKPHAVRDGKRVRGEVVAVIERTPGPISGTLEYDGSFYYLIPDEAKYYVDFLVAEKGLNGAKPGDKVIGAFVRWEHPNASPEARVVEVLGQSGKAVVEFAAILKEFRLPLQFPADVEAEAAAAVAPPSRPPKHRVNLTKDLIITIDPEDARDFDDALSLTVLENGNLELGVHIADVTHYVTEGSALDREAQKRGNSTYLVDCVVPMLPERLSNDLCSLVPNVNRFAFSVHMEFTPRGVRKAYRIEETIIKSKRRYSYDEVQTIIDSKSGDNVELILQLHKLSRTLFQLRMKNGGIDFATQEVKFILDENKMPVKATVKTRTDATSLVEECMLAANRTVAEHLHTLKKSWRTKTLPPYIYRIHDEPEPEKLGEALAVIRALGYTVPPGKLTPLAVNAILAQAEGKPEQPVINTLLLRSMSKAVYAEHNIGHYGLGFKDYAHFTSPIRRYPDLYVHRVLKEYAKGKPDSTRWDKLLRAASAAADHCSQTERGSVEAERASTKLAQTILAREHLGEQFTGTVTGVTSFGVFVSLDDLMIEGLLHIRDLNDDYYFFDDKRMRLVGRRHRKVYQFGSRVDVRIAKADVEKRVIDLHLILPTPPTAQPQKQEQASQKKQQQPQKKQVAQQTDLKTDQKSQEQIQPQKPQPPRRPKRRSRES